MLGMRRVCRGLPCRCPLLCGRGDGRKPEEATATASRRPTVSPAGRAMRSAPGPATSRKRRSAHILELLSAKAAFEIPHRQSGGAVTAILANALDEG